MKFSNNKNNVKKKLNSPETGAALFNNPTSSSNSDANTDEGNLIPVLLKKKLYSCEAYWENTAQPLYWAEKHPSQIHSHSVSGCDHTWNKVCCGLFPMKECNLLFTLKHYGWDSKDLNSCWSALGPHEWIRPFMWWLRSNRLKVVCSEDQWARSLTQSSAVSKKATTTYLLLVLNMSSVVGLPSHKGWMRCGEGGRLEWGTHRSKNSEDRLLASFRRMTWVTTQSSPQEATETAKDLLWTSASRPLLEITVCPDLLAVSGGSSYCISGNLAREPATFSTLHHHPSRDPFKYFIPPFYTIPLVLQTMSMNISLRNTNSENEKLMPEISREEPSSSLWYNSVQCSQHE